MSFIPDRLGKPVGLTFGRGTDWKSDGGGGRLLINCVFGKGSLT
jgi:hypothetical protein